MDRKKILVVEDEASLRNMLIDYLEREGFSAIGAADGKEAVKRFVTEKPDFVVLDLMLPSISGEDVFIHIRKTSNIPVLMLTAKSEPEDRITGFALGADDYVTKPFSNRELVMRIKAILRRVEPRDIADDDVLRFANDALTIQKSEHMVKKNGREISLTPSEYTLLLSLAQNKNRVFSREQLIKTAWGYDFLGYDRTIDSHIKNIRKKIEDDPKNPRLIATVYGIGYKFMDEGRT